METRHGLMHQAKTVFHQRVSESWYPHRIALPCTLRDDAALGQLDAVAARVPSASARVFDLREQLGDGLLPVGDFTKANRAGQGRGTLLDLEHLLGDRLSDLFGPALGVVHGPALEKHHEHRASKTSIQVRLQHEFLQQLGKTHQ